MTNAISEYESKSNVNTVVQTTVTNCVFERFSDFCETNGPQKRVLHEKTTLEPASRSFRQLVSFVNELSGLVNLPEVRAYDQQILLRS